MDGGGIIMKRGIVLFLLGQFFLCGYGYGTSITKLINVGVTVRDLSTQATFIFDQNKSIRPSIVIDGSRVEIFFSNVEVGRFEMGPIKQQLFSSELVDSIELVKKNEGIGVIFSFRIGKVILRDSSIIVGGRGEYIFEFYSKEVMKGIEEAFDGPLWYI